MAKQHTPLENRLVSVGIVLLKAVCRLPPSIGYALGRTLGYATARFSRSRKNTCRTNLALCFPELTKAERKALLTRTFANNGVGLIETGWAWWADPKPFWEHLEVEGQEHLTAALDNGQGVLLVGGHFSALDLGGLLFAKLANRFAATYRPHNFQQLEDELLTGRGRFMDLIDRNDVRGIFRALDANQIVWFAPDQDLGRARSEFAPFFGIPAATNAGLRKLAKRGAVPVAISFFRIKPMHYKLVLRPWPSDPKQQTDAEFATTMNQLLEQAIRTHPSQYMWLHKRFKTRPAGAPSVYQGDEQ